MKIDKLIDRLRQVGMVRVFDTQTGEEGIFWQPMEQPPGLIITHCTPIANFKALFPTVKELLADTTRGFAPLVQQLQQRRIL